MIKVVSLFPVVVSELLLLWLDWIGVEISNAVSMRGYRTIWTGLELGLLRNSLGQLYICTEPKSMCMWAQSF